MFYTIIQNPLVESLVIRNLFDNILHFFPFLVSPSDMSAGASSCLKSLFQGQFLGKLSLRQYNNDNGNCLLLNTYYVPGFMYIGFM